VKIIRLRTSSKDSSTSLTTLLRTSDLAVKNAILRNTKAPAFYQSQYIVFGREV